jgi:beta-glucosidase/6-phospho-beta-glucosidase/beta-galactosidase
MFYLLSRKLESSLLPLPCTLIWKKGEIFSTEWSLIQRIKYLASQSFQFVVSLAFLPLAAAASLSTRILTRHTPPHSEIEIIDSPNLLSSSLPDDFGFADSLFQTSGLGTDASATVLKGRSNWNRWLTPEHIEGTSTYRDFFVDILNHPRPFIEILKKMNVTAHRFSLEWAVIEPEPGKLDHKAIALYRNFIQELKNGGIEPYVTLHHFVLPEWFGDFEKLEDIELFVTHSLKMIELFPMVKNWMTFNEPAVYALQTRIRGVFPPGRKNLPEAAQVLRNLLIAHCKIYKEAKAKFGDKVQIGITHQWLNFEPLAGNL